MKNKFLLGLFMIAILSLCFTYASSSNGWVEGHKVSESEWLKNTCPNLKNFSCDYTGDPVVLRVGYGVEFTDSIYAGGQDRWLKSQCSEIFEPDENGNYNKGDNPGFEFTENIRTAGGLVVKNNTPATLIIKSKADYQIRNHPVKRSSNNLMVKYAVEYVNDKKDNKQRYQHTECYPYIISRCGDGVVDKDWDGRCDKNGNNCKNPEQCDPASKDWIDRADGKTCSSTCTIVEPQDPVCSSSYNGKTEHTTSSEQWLKSTDKLCDEGSVDGFNFTPKTGGPRTYTWNCKNGSKITKSSCTAKQQWCGDGEKNGDEDCDDGDKNGTSASSCSKTCTTVGSATCGKKDGTTTYFTGGKQTEPWLTEKSDGLCPAGLTVGKPKMVGDYIEWTCSNKNGSERTCKAYQEWCGDGEKNGSEDCDGTDLCDFQCKKITPPKDCVNVFKGKLRLGQEHTFSDKFKAGGKDYYLYYGPDDVKFVENHGDYGTNPKFEWTSELTKKGNKVDANTEMVVMKSNPYKAVYKPTVRAWDNIYLEYTIWYSDVYKKTSPSKSNLYSNKECAYYEISWCGDGTLDTEYGEECDPGSAGTTSLSGGRICNSECKIESPKGTAVIEKTLKDKIEVTHTGQELIWEVKVTASGGNVTNFEIWDKMPVELEPNGTSWWNLDKTKSQNGIDVKYSNRKPNPKSSGNVNIHYWDVTGTLNQGKSITMLVKTKVKKMPGAGENIVNIACVIKDNKEIDCGEDQPPKPKGPKLWIKKYIMDGTKKLKEKTVNIGDEIIYRIEFGNKGQTSATITSIKDFLPKNVGYRSSEIYVGGKKIDINLIEDTQKGELILTNKYKVVDGVHIDIFGGLTLAPNTEGYIIIKGEILSGNQDNRTNFACIYLNDKKPDDDIVDGPRCDDAVHNFDMCEKLDILPAGNLNGGGSKTVTCTTMSGNADINIDCGLGATPRYITGSNINKLQGVCTYPAGVKTYNLKCTVKKDGKTYKSNPSCKGNVTVQEGSTPGGFKCQSDIKDTTGTVCNGESWTVPVNCKTDGGRANKIEIFCDNSVQSSGTNVASLTGSCTFSSNGAHKIRCEVDGSTAAVNGSSCEGVYTLSHKDCGGGQTVNCGTLDVSGTDRVKNFECKATGLTNSMKLECGYNKQSYTKTGSVSSLTGTCDFTNAPYGKYTIKCYVNDDENKSCIKEVTYSSSTPPGGPTGGPTPDPIIAPMAECFDINANQVSYEQGEILPFYWNLDNLSKNDIWYLSGSFSKKVKDGDKCEKDAEGLVALNSMECSYDIVDPDGTVKKTGNFPCLTEENFTVNHLYQSRLDIGKNKMCGTSNNKCYFDFTTKATKTRLWSKLNAIENFGAGWTRFGEYKIRMKKISYLRCNDGEWDSKEKSGESLCESTFMLTNPYTVQKTPSGNFRASTEALSNYRYCEKYKEVIDPNVKQECLRWNNADKLLNAIAVSEYQPNKAVDDAMQKFINKYSKLAVSAGDGLKKVPGKNIYFVNADIPCLGSQCPKSIDLSKPTTFVQTQGNTTIKGDLDSNLMLLTKGKIIFEDQESCNHRQVVKGIFYSALPVNGIQRTPVQKNTADRLKESNAKRCTEGGLTVKGVLIGNGLKQVMENSRSNLNKWHHSKTAQTVMNGASVLIEYSPSVFTKSTMPPGAEDFTTALSIYKD